MKPTKIIVVEDERIVALHLKQQLSELGYEVAATVASGANALQKITELRPDLILMDIRIEGELDGIEVAARIPDEFRIPVIYVTASSEQATLKRAGTTKPYGYLVKPFSERDLHATIQIALERRRLDSVFLESREQVKRERDTAQRYLDVAGVLILALNVDGNVTLINRRGCSILGHDEPNDIVGKPWIETFLPGRLRDEMQNAFRLLISEPEISLYHTNPVVTRTGEERLVAWHNSVLFDENGRVSGTLSSGEDITDQQQAEDKLRLSEERFRSIFSAVSEGIFISDAATGHFLEVNEPGASMMGYGVDELIGQDIQSISSDVPPYTQVQAIGWIEKAESTGLPQVFDWQSKAKDGRVFETEVSLRLASLSGRRVVLAIVRDVTERRAIEAQLRQAQKMEAIGNLTGGMAHDFNNVLSVIIGNLDMLREVRPDDSEVTDLSGEAVNAAIRGADLTRRLLAFSRRQPLQPKRLDLNSLVTNVVKLLSRLIGENIEISLNLAPDVCRIVADPAQLEAALTNLATNARDAMPRGGKLMVSTGNRFLDTEYATLYPEVVAGDYAMIEVTDTGTGMPPEVLDHIFEPFYTTKDRDKGTGLGLSMVFGFLKQSGGHLSVYSEVGVGTTFRLYFACDAEIVEAALNNGNAAVVSLGHGEKVLAVEDNVALRRILTRQLRELGYSVLEAGNAMEGLVLLEGESVDLLMTDIVMPGEMDGFELARIATARWPALKVLLTSGFPETKLTESFQSTSLRLLIKPYRKEDLAQLMREILDT